MEDNLRQGAIAWNGIGGDGCYSHGDKKHWQAIPIGYLLIIIPKECGKAENRLK